MDEQFSHDGGQRDFGRFALGAKLFVVRLEERVVQRGAERGPVESLAGRGATTPDVPLSAPRMWR